MLFNSISFLFFFPLVTAAYFLLPQRWRWALLLAASCGFYMAFIPVYILILAVTIVIDYWAGIYIERSTGKRRKTYLVVSIISTCAVLFIFKYYNFFVTNVNGLASFLHWNYSVEVLNIILPIGLSFHTFQSLSYVIEVYRGHQKAEHHFGIYSLYVMFYPQLVAGPIERPQNLLHQFYEHHRVDYERVVGGLRLMAWGMFKKVVIADRLAPIVNNVYGEPSSYPAGTLIIATVFFAFQIYCDFSGYSDIAIGSAKVMGFKLMRNFRSPYYAQTISEFWRRWHISLSTWFKDYLYIPLGGNRTTRSRWYFNLFITFMISGLWHGANWTYVIWGALHGAYLVIGEMTRSGRERIATWTGLAKVPWLRQSLQVATIFVLVSIAWVFFRAESAADAWYILSRSFTGIGELLHPGTLQAAVSAMQMGKLEIAIAMLAIAAMEVVHWIDNHGGLSPFLAGLPPAVRWSLYYGVMGSIIYFGAFYETSQFIYFQF